MTVAGAGKRLAGTSVAVAITGYGAIDKRLKRLEPKLQKKVYLQSMRAAMKIVQEDAQANARAAFVGATKRRAAGTTRSGGKSRSTGATVRGIKVRATKRSRKRFGVDVRVNGGAYVDKTYYAAFLEFGTRKMKPMPFLAPAYAAKKRMARMVAMKAMLAGLNVQVKGLAKGKGKG